jgi:dTDP-4-amino-4,6-dideoxygalactose transaminase
VTEPAKDAVENVLDSGMLADGPEVRAFESEFAEYCGTDHGVAVANGTAALHAALHGVGIGEGDTVLTTSMSFVATANTIRLVGAEPVFVDIDPETYNLDPQDAATTLAERDIDAIVAVHLYGLPAEMNALRRLADEHDAWLIEDAAQAHGATYQGDRVGSLGDVACFSFYPTKNMTTGEGGVVVSDNEDVIERTRRFINHGRNGKYDHVSVGHNFRMTSVAAAMGRVQLERLPEMIETRRRNARLLTEGLTETAVEPPTVPEHVEHAYHQYTVRVDDRDRFIEHLESHDVGTGVYYPKAIHEQPAYDDYDVMLPRTERATDEVVSLPVHHNVSAAECDQIVEAVEAYDV